MGQKLQKMDSYKISKTGQMTENSLKSSIFQGAAYGLLAWLTYGVVEFVLTYVSHRSLQVLSWQWRLMGLLFGVYGVFGLVLGAAGGVLLRGDRKRYPVMAALTLVSAFAIHILINWPINRREYGGLAIAVVLAYVFARALMSGTWLERSLFLSSPWFVSLLLLISPWVCYEALTKRSETTQLAASLVLAGGIVAAAAFWRRLRSGRPSALPRQAAALAAAAALVYAGVAILQRTPSVHAAPANMTSAEGKCNIVLITMDTVRADHLSVYGYGRDTTPSLREFAKGATLYRHAIAAADMTLPTHASIFTGLYPGWHGAFIDTPLAPQHVTLAKVLRANGYWAAGVGANWAFLTPVFGLNQGFEDYAVPKPVQFGEPPSYLREMARQVLDPVVNTNDFEVRSLRAADINRHALDWLRQAGHRGPFFLFLNYMDAHTPYVPPPPFNTKFPGRDPHFAPFSDYARLKRAVLDHTYRLRPSERDHLTSQYDGGLAYLDSEIGHLLRELREMGLYDNTLILITADHGEAFGEHDSLEHAIGFLYQDQVHVPLLVKYPRQQEGRISDEMASDVDFMPTVLECAHLKAPANLQGRPLQLTDNTTAPGVVYAADGRLTSIGDAKVPLRFQGLRRAAFSGSLELITWSQGPPELYDLATDPAEAHNLYRADDPLAAALMSHVKTWSASIPRQHKLPAKVDKSVLEGMRSLGYIQQ